MSLHQHGTVFQTAPPYFVIIPRLRPGLLSLRSVLASSQSYQQLNNKTTKQPDNNTTRQLNNQTTRQYIDISVSVVQSSRQGLVCVALFC